MGQIVHTGTGTGGMGMNTGMIMGMRMNTVLIARMGMDTATPMAKVMPPQHRN